MRLHVSKTSRSLFSLPLHLSRRRQTHMCCQRFKCILYFVVLTKSIVFVGFNFLCQSFVLSQCRIFVQHTVPWVVKNQNDPGSTNVAVLWRRAMSNGASDWGVGEWSSSGEGGGGEGSVAAVQTVCFNWYRLWVWYVVLFQIQLSFHIFPCLANEDEAHGHMMRHGAITLVSHVLSQVVGKLVYRSSSCSRRSSMMVKSQSSLAKGTNSSPSGTQCPCLNTVVRGMGREGAGSQVQAWLLTLFDTSHYPTAHKILVVCLNRKHNWNRSYFSKHISGNANMSSPLWPLQLC